MDPGRLAGLVEAQQVEALLAGLNAVPVAAGDTVLVPPDAAPSARASCWSSSEEPTDFSVLLEWEGFAIDGRAEGHLGLGFDVALGCVDRAGWSRHDWHGCAVGGGRRARGPSGCSRPRPTRSSEPSGCDRTRTSGDAFSILVVTEVGPAGERGGSLELGRGDTALVPSPPGRARCAAGSRRSAASPARTPDTPRERRGAAGRHRRRHHPVQGGGCRAADGTEWPRRDRTPGRSCRPGPSPPERLLEAAVAATAAALEHAPAARSPASG